MCVVLQAAIWCLLLLLCVTRCGSFGGLKMLMNEFGGGTVRVVMVCLCDGPSNDDKSNCDV